jgi:hypothetical protein
LQTWWLRRKDQDSMLSLWVALSRTHLLPYSLLRCVFPYCQVSSTSANSPFLTCIDPGSKWPGALSYLLVSSLCPLTPHSIDHQFYHWEQVLLSWSVDGHQLHIQIQP